jgi:hypothetical protein
VASVLALEAWRSGRQVWVGALAVYLVGWVKDQWHLGAIYLVSGGFIVLIIIGIMVLLRLTQGSPYKNKAARTALCRER